MKNARSKTKAPSLEFSPDIVHQAPAALRQRQGHARKHSDKQLSKLAASIREFGFLVPVIVDAENFLVTGHARVEAAKRVGLPAVTTICASHLSPTQARAYRLADNRLAELGVWDLELLRIELSELQALDLDFNFEVLGWETAELDMLTVQQLQEDDADPADTDGVEPSEDAVTRVGDIWAGSYQRLDIFRRQSTRLICVRSALRPPYPTLQRERFMTLNDLDDTTPLTPGMLVQLVVVG